MFLTVMMIYQFAFKHNFPSYEQEGSLTPTRSSVLRRYWELGRRRILILGSIRSTLTLALCDVVYII